MRGHARVLAGGIAGALAALVGGAGAAAAAEADPLVCGPVEQDGGAHVSCTVAGPEGSEATLVLAVADAGGAEEAFAASQHIVGAGATFTADLPDGAARVIALALIDGTEVASDVVAMAPSVEVDAVTLDAPNVTVAGAAFGTLAIGAIIVYASAVRRGAENRRIGAYRGALT